MKNNKSAFEKIRKPLAPPTKVFKNKKDSKKHLRKKDVDSHLKNNGY